MKRILCLVAAACLMLLCGCSLFEKEYLYISDYDSNISAPAEPEIGAIDSYDALLNSLEGMVSRHQESAELQFNNYVGSISEDMAAACWQVKSASTLGSYMVDYISYDISRIVTYYQAVVYINYTRTAEELEQIHTIGANKIAETVIDAVTNGETTLSMQLYTSAIDGDAMAQRVENALLSAPDVVSVIPDISVSVYGGTGLQRIFEVDFDYRGAENIPDRCTELKNVVETVSARIRVSEPYSIAILAANALGDRCRYSAEDQTGTAYDALIGGTGGSRALSMAYAAVCGDKGLEYKIVRGLKNNESYYWVQVKIGDYWYHADVCEAIGLPDGTPFLRNDAEMIRSFRWDELEYASCEGPSLLIPAENAEKNNGN